jgi:hypothetical protein
MILNLLKVQKLSSKPEIRETSVLVILGKVTQVGVLLIVHSIPTSVAYKSRIKPRSGSSTTSSLT